MRPATPVERWRTVAGTFSSRAAAVEPGAWSNPSPCEGWTARDVVRHLTEWVPPFLADGSDIRIGVGPTVDEDPSAAWEHLASAIESTLAADDIDDLIFDHERVGRLPLATAIERFILGDVLIHTWDLARATGQDERLDPEFVRFMLAGLQAMGDTLEKSGQYGPPVPVPETADPQTRLLALTGRSATQHNETTDP